MEQEALTPTISVVVPATGVHPTLADCVAAIHASAHAPDEVVVVTEPASAGPAEARNLGAAQVTGDVVVFVDSDLLIHEDALARIRAAFAGDPSLTALFGSYDDTPAASGAVSEFRNLLHHHIHQEAAGPAQTFWAGLGAIRRDAFLAAGGFDEAAFHRASIEDVELGMRLSASGARIELDPAVQGKHLKHWTLAEMLKTDYGRRGLPWVKLLLQSGSMPRHLNLAWRHRLSAAASVAGLLAIVLRRPRALTASAISLVALNRSLYALILRRGGPAQVVVALGVHALHHLAATASVVTGVATHLVRRGRPAQGAARSPQAVPVDKAPAGARQRNGDGPLADARGRQAGDDSEVAGIETVGPGE